jgi:hypothetical protein
MQVACVPDAIAPGYPLSELPIAMEFAPLAVAPLPLPSLPAPIAMPP